MAKTQIGSGNLVIIKNLADGPRDYPLADGSALYLKPKHKGDAGQAIRRDQISEAMKRAEQKGHIAIFSTPAEKAIKAEQKGGDE